MSVKLGKVIQVDVRSAWLIQQLERMRPVFQTRALALSDGNGMPMTEADDTGPDEPEEA